MMSTTHPPTALLHLPADLFSYILNYLAITDQVSFASSSVLAKSLVNSISGSLIAAIRTGLVYQDKQGYRRCLRNPALVFDIRTWLKPADIRKAMHSCVVRFEHSDYWGSNAIEMAASKGYFDIVYALLADSRVDPSCNRNEVMTQMVIHGRLDIISDLLQDRRIDPSRDHNRVLAKAAHFGRTDIFTAIYADDRVAAGYMDGALICASHGGHLSMVDHILSIPYNGPYPDRQHRLEIPLIQACEFGHLEIVRYFLDDSEIDVSLYQNGDDAPLVKAAYNGHLAIVKLFLSHPRVELTKNDSNCLHIAIDKEQLEIVLTFLSDSRFNPPGPHHYTLDTTIGFDPKAFYEAHLSDPRNQRPGGLTRAAAYGATEAVKSILLERSYIFNAKDDRALRHAVARGHLDVVRLLLADPRVDPNLLDSYEGFDDYDWSPLVIAVKEGHAKIVKVLLAEKRVDRFVRNKYGESAWDFVDADRDPDIVEMLRNAGMDPRKP